MYTLEKIKITQPKDIIADMLRREIFSGQIADGEEFTQEQLAERFEVSRMPVREAFQILELEGMLLRLPNRRMRVVGLHESTVQENMRVIAAIETEITMIAMRHNKDAILALEPDSAGQFHTRISKLASNHYISHFHMKLLNGYPKYIWDSIPNHPDYISLDQAILAAIKEGDESDIKKSIQRCYDFLANLLLNVIKEEKEYEQPETN